MTHWEEFSPADFDARRAARGAAKRAAAAADQAGLFFVPTPVARPAKSAPVPEQLPGQAGLFGDDDQGDEQP